MPQSNQHPIMSDGNLELITQVGMQEGWALFKDGLNDHNYRIERDDEADVFPGDDEAIAFVERLALLGSKVHKLALDVHGFRDEFKDFLPLDVTSIEAIDQLALSEGWVFGTVSDRGEDRFQISKLDDSSTFASDADAYAFVKLKAAAGGAYHKMAMAAHGKSHCAVTGMVSVKAEVKISVTYLVPVGMKTSELHDLLDTNVNHLIGSGGLTGDTEAEAESYNVDIKMDI